MAEHTYTKTVKGKWGRWGGHGKIFPEQGTSGQKNKIQKTGQGLFTGKKNISIRNYEKRRAHTKKKKKRGWWRRGVHRKGGRCSR